MSAEQLPRRALICLPINWIPYGIPSPCLNHSSIVLDAPQGYVVTP